MKRSDQLENDMKNFDPRNYQIQITSFFHTVVGKIIFCARVIEIKTIYVEENTVKKAYDRAIDEIKIFKKHYEEHDLDFPVPLVQQKFSGELRVRIGKDLHRQIAAKAAALGLSLNKYIKEKLQAS